MKTVSTQVAKALIKSIRDDNPLESPEDLKRALYNMIAAIEDMAPKLDEFEEALIRIRDAEVRADRRMRGMADIEEVRRLQRIARAALED